jgi:predicted nucleic acid-binding protein
VIFVDTSFFFAFFSEMDKNHGRAVKVFEEFEGRAIESRMSVLSSSAIGSTAKRRLASIGRPSTSNAPPSTISSGMPTRSTADSG